MERNSSTTWTHTRRLTVGCALALGLLVGTPTSDAARFSGPYNATSVSKKYVCSVNSAYNYDMCVYGYGGSWNSYTNQCTSCYYEQAYYAGAKRGDVMHFEAGAAAGVATLIQQLAFGSAALKIHTAVCSSTSSSGCTQIWENTANASMSSIFNSLDSCSKIDNWHSSELSSLSPGMQWAAAMTDPYGKVTYFRPLDASLITKYSDNSYSHLGPRYGGSYTYKVGGYTRYKPYSMCSETVSDAMELDASEGDGQVSMSKTEVQSILNNAHSAIYSICRDEIDGRGAWWCWSQGGREGICKDIADRALNAFMDESWRNKGSPVARAVSGITAPSLQYCYMAGACTGSQCQPATCSSLGKTCGTWSNGCGSTVTCGPTCSTSGGGYTGGG